MPTSAQTITDAFRSTVAARADEPALRSHDRRVAWSWREYAERARETAGGLHGLGLRAGDTMACWLTSRPELHLADTAAMHLGVACASIDERASLALAEHVLVGSGAQVVVTERRHAARIAAVRAAGRTRVRAVVCLDGCSDPSTMDWAELIDGAPDGFDLEASAASVRPEDLATRVTTASAHEWPRSVGCSHRQAREQAEALGAELGLPAGTSVLSWLPMTGLRERVVAHYLPIVNGWTVTTCRPEERDAGGCWRPHRPSGDPRAATEVRLSATGAVLVRDALAP